MDFEYFEEDLQKYLGKSSYAKDKAYWAKVYNSAEKHDKLFKLEEIMAEFKYQLQNNVIDNPPAYLTTMVTKDIPMESANITRFEGNLVEHPFFRQGKRTNNPITITNVRIDKLSNTKVKTEWSVTSDSLIPNDEDCDVFNALKLLFHEQGLPESGEVLFTRYELCTRLNKVLNGAQYKQIENAIKYLFDVKITSKEAFYRYKDKIFLNSNSEETYVRLISEYTLKHNSDKDVDGSSEMWQSRVVLGSYIVENLRLYYSVYIDWDYYINMRYNISKRMYAYLQKKRGSDKKNTWKQKLIPFAETMGISVKIQRNIKHNLKNALNELIDKKYIEEYKIIKDQKTEFITFKFPPSGKQAKLEFE